MYFGSQLPKKRSTELILRDYLNDATYIFTFLFLTQN